MRPPGEVNTSIDDHVRAFEDAWARGGAAELASFLPDRSHPLYARVLSELVRVDIEFRWQHGRPRSLAEYLADFPALAGDEAGLRGAAYEEFRQRHQAGQNPKPEEYQERFGVPVAGWAQFSPRPASADERPDFVMTDCGDTSSLSIPDGSTQRPRPALIPSRTPRPGDEVRDLLRGRLRLISLGAVGVLAYFALLVLLTPSEKAGLFLEHPGLIALNWAALAACAALAAVLWSRLDLSLRWLRLIESCLVVVFLAEMSLGLFSDLFFDHELRQPLAEGDHALFHYASSWALPFFALIVGYGALVPSTGRRCAVVVAPLALVPLVISAAAGVAEGAIGRPFLVSFLLQMALWMAAGAAIAAFGAYRLESLRAEATQARRLGQYRLGRWLGGGAMGEVYLAEHVLLCRPCAVKVIRPAIAGDADVLRRFEQEARAMASLTHPNTAQVYDYGHAADGTFYFAMEYLPGLNLGQLVAARGALPAGRTVRLLRQVCGALGEAHRAGLIHRDIKPSNIILCERGGIPDVAKLLDFGLVQGAVPGRADEPRREGVFIGTPSYTSPEQAAGRPELDARTDIYSLGAVAYFLLSGRPPFARGNAVETLAAQARESPAPLAELRPDVPADLAAVVLRCLEKDPSQRFPSAEELEQALASCRCAV